MVDGLLAATVCPCAFDNRRVTEIRNEGTRNNLPTHFDGTTEMLSISQIWSTYGEQKASGTLAANFLDAKNNFLDAKNKHLAV